MDKRLIDKRVDPRDPTYLQYCTEGLINLSSKVAGFYKECKGCGIQETCSEYSEAVGMRETAFNYN